MACQSCHDPEHAFQGNNGSRIAAVAVGSRPDQFGIRKVPSIMYKTYSPPFGFYKDEDEGENKLEARGGQFWDGRANTLVDQVSVPMLNPIEMNNPSIEAVVAKMKDADYGALLKEAFGDAVFDDPKTAMEKAVGSRARLRGDASVSPRSHRNSTTGCAARRSSRRGDARL